MDLAKLTCRVAEAREIAKMSKRIAEFVASRPGLEQAFQTNHQIVGDIYGKLQRWGSISDAQVALVIKIAADEKTRKERDAARKATAKPVLAGRYQVEGTILSTKLVDSNYGSSLKMLVQLADGSRVWGTCPASLTVRKKACP